MGFLSGCWWIVMVRVVLFVLDGFWTVMIGFLGCRWL